MAHLQLVLVVVEDGSEAQVVGLGELDVQLVGLFCVGRLVLSEAHLPQEGVVLHQHAIVLVELEGSDGVVGVGLDVAPAGAVRAYHIGAMTHRAILEVKAVLLYYLSVGQSDGYPVVLVVDDAPAGHLLLVAKGTIVQSELVHLGSLASNSHVGCSNVRMGEPASPIFLLVLGQPAADFGVNEIVISLE